MRIALDIEADSLTPTVIHCLVIGDILDGSMVTIFTKEDAARWFASNQVDLIVAHNGIGYDFPVLAKLWDIQLDRSKCRDTLILSRLLNQAMHGGHSLEAWGERLSFPKTSFSDFSKLSYEMVEYCQNDVKLNIALYNYLLKFFKDDYWKQSVVVEHEMAWICEDMKQNGFRFNRNKAIELRTEIAVRVAELDTLIQAEYKPIKVLTHTSPVRYKKDGTLTKRSSEAFKRIDLLDPLVELHDDMLSYYEWQVFNPGSSKQICERLQGFWEPVEKTDGHLQAIEDNNLSKLEYYKVYGWKTTEQNLGTLTDNAPSAARYLVERILLGSRLRTLDGWLEACQIQIEIDITQPTENIIATILSITKNTCENTGKKIENIIDSTTKNTARIILKLNETDNTSDAMELLSKNLILFLTNKVESVKSAKKVNPNYASIIVIQQEELEVFSAPGVTLTMNGTSKIRATFNPLGTWTHRLSHSKPNVGNVSAEKTIKYKTESMRKIAIHYGGEFRKLFIADEDSYLIGTDMEGAHLRLFAHFVNDEELIKALVSGDKKLGTDPHTLNKQKIGPLCPDRDLAKTFIFTFLNGGGAPKVAEIFRTTIPKARGLLTNFIASYPGLQYLREDVFPQQAAQGWFTGLDGRKVLCDSTHFMMAGYLQNGEAVVVKNAVVRCMNHFKKEKLPVKIINIVHDEIQFNAKGDMDLAKYVGEYSSDMIRQVGEDFGLRCPLAGEYKIGVNWLESH